MQANTDRRTEPRGPFIGEARVRTGEVDIVCRAVNLSSTGILLLSPVRAQPGLSMQLDFYLPQLDKWGQAEAVLIRQTPHEGRMAWGVQFCDISPFMGTVFRTYTRRLLRGDYTSETPTADQSSASSVREAHNRRPGVTSARQNGSAASAGATAGDGPRDDHEPLTAGDSPSESGLRALYRDAIADLSAKAGGGRRRQPARRLWPFR